MMMIDALQVDTSLETAAVAVAVVDAAFVVAVAAVAAAVFPTSFAFYVKWLFAFHLDVVTHGHVADIASCSGSVEAV